MLDSVQSQLLRTTDSDFRFLDESLEQLKDVQPFGGFSRADFPEIRSGQEALALANSLQQAEAFLVQFTQSLNNPKRHQMYEHLIMVDTPSLIISSDPRLHFFWLTGRFGETVPQELVAPMRALWRDSLAQQALLLAEKEPWQAAYRSATLDSGVSFPPPGGEDIFPPLARYNQLLKNKRETYLRNLKKLFRDHGLMDGS